MDTTGDGRLQPHELAAVFTLFQVGKDKDRFTFLFHCLDLDGSGKVNQKYTQKNLCVILFISHAFHFFLIAIVRFSICACVFGCFLYCVRQIWLLKNTLTGKKQQKYMQYEKKKQKNLCEYDNIHMHTKNMKGGQK